VGRIPRDPGAHNSRNSCVHTDNDLVSCNDISNDVATIAVHNTTVGGPLIHCAKSLNDADTETFSAKRRRLQCCPLASAPAPTHLLHTHHHHIERNFGFGHIADSLVATGVSARCPDICVWLNQKLHPPDTNTQFSMTFQPRLVN